MDWKKSLPSGTKDKLFREANGLYKLLNKLNSVFLSRGYQRIETPTIEFEDVFKNETDGSSGLYRFFDRKGRLLVLRPDMTLPIGRVLATTAVITPLQLFYTGKVFKSTNELSGEQSELIQSGIEILGFPSYKAEVEAIICASKALKSIEIDNFHIELGHAKIYDAILSNFDLSETEEAAFKVSLLNKNITELEQFVATHPSSLNRFIIELPRLFGDIDEMIPYARELVNNQTILDALNDIDEIVTRVHSYNPAITLSVDIGLVQSLSYYSGVIFRGYADDTADAILSGGRYDHLLEKFGAESIPAVGLAFNVDTLVALQYRLNLFPQLPTSSTLIYYEEECISQAEALHEKTPYSRISLFDSFEDASNYAKQWDFDTLIKITSNGTQTIDLREVLN